MWNKMWHEKSSYPVLALPPEIRQGLFVPTTSRQPLELVGILMETILLN